MPHAWNRRDWLRWLGTSGLAAGTAAAVRGEDPPPAEGSGFQSHIVDAHHVQAGHGAARVVDGRVIQPQRELPVLHQTDVLVVGGGPAGVAAAIAARRTGAEVTLVERYGHFGGLWTGGLVLIVLGHIVQGGKQVCQGIGEEMLRRLEKLDGGVINRKPGVNPTVDAEATKYVMLEMIEEAGVKVFLHCWGVDAIVNGNAAAGAVFESKSGRQAILAKVVVDTTGDGDLFAAAGAEFELRTHNIGLVSRIGNVDRIAPSPDAKAKDSPGKAAPARPRHLGSATPIAGINWVNQHGPEADGLDVATLTRLEIENRKSIWRNLQRNRQIPGCEKLCLVETAPQLGVRITRVLTGLKTVTEADHRAGVVHPDVIGVGGGTKTEWQIPYGALVPVKIDGVLAAGRCASAERRMADLVRLIPNCLVTGHAAGAAAAIAVHDSCPPRQVDVPKLQKILRQQEAYLG